ncbi:MAG TPA: ABC transporter permease, partial [Actinomycetota bacterium]|nr:ABC transporter permease [Actinomycetota bacterium]
MYPNLTPTLVALLVIALLVIAFLAMRQTFLRRLALRQVSRRRREAALVILGSMLGTAIVIGSLIVGDTLNFSVKQAAYENLGPIDEMVMSTNLAQGAAVAARLASLRSNPDVDGVMYANGGVAAVRDGTGVGEFAEPRAAVWDLDFARAATFGGTANGGSGLAGPAPKTGTVVLNADLASALHARVGDVLTFYPFGRQVIARVARIVPTRGLAGVPIDGITKDAFFTAGSLAAAARDAGLPADVPGVGPRSFTFVSNTGGVESGAPLSEQVARAIRATLGPMAANGTSVDTIKKTVLDEAKQTGDSLGSLFLMIGTFAIIAGILLLVNIFVMLAEERKPELGMLRAVGMKRSRLVRAFIIEGSVYALFASLLGVLVG